MLLRRTGTSSCSVVGVIPINCKSLLAQILNNPSMLLDIYGVEMLNE